MYKIDCRTVEQSTYIAAEYFVCDTCKMCIDNSIVSFEEIAHMHHQTMTIQTRILWIYPCFFVLFFKIYFKISVFGRKTALSIENHNHQGVLIFIHIQISYFFHFPHIKNVEKINHSNKNMKIHSLNDVNSNKYLTSMLYAIIF